MEPIKGSKVIINYKKMKENINLLKKSNRKMKKIFHLEKYKYKIYFTKYQY